MTTWKPGESPSGLSLVPLTLVREEKWGEVWRARHPAHGNVLAVVYRGDHGAALFNESRPGLEKWRDAPEAAALGRMRLLEITTGAGDPLVLVRDTGGRTLREAADDLDQKSLARAMAAVQRTITALNAVYMTPVNMTPDTIIEDPAGGEFPWKLLPVAPGASRTAGELGGGRYTAPELAGAASPAETNSDVFAFAWIWAEGSAGDFTLARTPAALREAVPFPRLRTFLLGGIAAHGGAYADWRLLGIGTDRWIRKEAELDFAEVAEAKAAGERKGWDQFLYQHRGALRRAGITLATVAALALAVFLACQSLVIRDTDKTPRGIVNLYLESFVKRDFDGAKKFVEPSGVLHTDMLARDLERIESAGLVSRMKVAIPEVRGSGPGRTAKVAVLGEEGDVVFRLEMNIIQQPDERWRIRDIFYSIPADEPDEAGE
jgi:hypothetical protein